jgi:hypothetical protein
MNEDKTDQGWQRIQERVDQIVGRFLRNDREMLEYKPGREIYLLEMPPATSAISLKE